MTTDIRAALPSTPEGIAGIESNKPRENLPEREPRHDDHHARTSGSKQAVDIGQYSAEIRGTVEPAVVRENQIECASFKRVEPVEGKDFEATIQARPDLCARTRDHVRRKVYAED
jgi:hypothetical protein